jgi:two-component system, chemotaxis family, protein-glutamate methylesterase/glutaminase
MAVTLVRVLVFDPSSSRRQRLQRLLEGDPVLHVIAGAGSAQQAIEAAARHHADVILVGQGIVPDEAVAATRSIMQARATPIVVVSEATLAVDDKQVFALMEAGALAVVRDPGGTPGPQQRAAVDKLRETLRLMAEVKVVRRWASAAAATPSPPLPVRAVTRRRTLPRGAPPPVELVAIGASTGGPVVLRQILGALPPSFPVPILIVQHMADGFLDGMAAWLTASCPVPVEVAGPATQLSPGRAYLAPDGAHMRIGPHKQLAFDADPTINGHRPAVSALLASVAEHHGRHAIGILLTGMGKDGAAELKLMKDAGAVTIAQDEASCVVHGMPGEAIRCGGATYIMSPDEIGAALPALVLRGKEVL